MHCTHELGLFTALSSPSLSATKADDKGVNLEASSLVPFLVLLLRRSDNGSMLSALQFTSSFLFPGLFGFSTQRLMRSRRVMSSKLPSSMTLVLYLM